MLVTNAKVVYGSSFRTVSGCENVTLKLGSWTTIVALGVARSGMSGWLGAWNVARMSMSSWCVPVLSASSVHSALPCAFAMRNVAPVFSSTIVIGCPNATGGFDAATRSCVGGRMFAVIESSRTSPSPPFCTMSATAKNWCRTAKSLGMTIAAGMLGRGRTCTLSIGSGGAGGSSPSSGGSSKKIVVGGTHRGGV